MTQEQIDKLISEGEFPETSSGRELIETHISWVILCDEFVYKIKKPIRYSFLDFYTVKSRKHYCNRELELNRRFAPDIYLEVLPIHEVNGKLRIGEHNGTLVDHALKMRKLNPDRRLDRLLRKGRVSSEHIISLALWIADFHKNSPVIREKDVLDVRDKFNDLATQKQFVSAELGEARARIIDWSVEVSDIFLQKNEALLTERLKAGFFRDCHGDLHTRNIFLLPAPQPFDCLEFNDDYRQIDVLNEVAFLCMDLDAFEKRALSDLCIQHYNLHFPAMRTSEEWDLFVYYKAYRANVRAKVNSIRARSESDKGRKQQMLAETQKYLGMMEGYLQSLPLA
jgi:aminoglycoside phosphotransferase family enzyme